MKPVNERDFFEEIWGFKESIKSVKEYLQIDTSSDKNHIISLINARTVQPGNFETRKINSFNEQDLVAKIKKKGTLSIVIGNGPHTTQYDRVDIGALQAHPANRGATFQVASNFNCLEFVDERDSASVGITKYVFDQTQGPAACISAAPGVLYRNYFVPHYVDGKLYKGQLEQQINLLNNFFIPVTNGYINFNGNELTEIYEPTWDDHFFTDYGDVKVGVQTNVEVTSGTKRDGLIYMVEQSGQIINQVFTASINLGGTRAMFASRPKIQKLAQMLLKAAYRGTILVAMENALKAPPELVGRNKLFLTLIGGGAFGNDLEWIVGALYEQLELIKRSGLEITLVIYAQYTVTEYALQTLQILAAETEGTVLNVQ
uniref:Uncharacterized protein n=1 Tax=Arcella intermedia TaxID=1963864 RepID=A0A6B2L742_9EUKA|eukprot:TRINITY_DN8572_c0_g1_i1.p1 TRINITY_DN8572_c0_g1~~TRINITY_DN8572_c0_g1_i1.p1  ORF type:complete len:383 (+),score=103.36 TRINITY_DN8572_c0_g1_i1:33-1151(+)